MLTSTLNRPPHRHNTGLTHHVPTLLPSLQVCSNMTIEFPPTINSTVTHSVSSSGGKYCYTGIHLIGMNSNSVSLGINSNFVSLGMNSNSVSYSVDMTAQPVKFDSSNLTTPLSPIVFPFSSFISPLFQPRLCDVPKLIVGLHYGTYMSMQNTQKIIKANHALVRP